MKRFSLPLLLFVLVAKLYAQGTRTDHVTGEMLRDWAEDDVKWIICPEEKSVFDRLTTDSERRGFIYRFWYRRDPNPETPISEAKEEHYRRLDFADEHFRENDIRGALTERGRVWIMYGPPQRREVYPRGGDSKLSWEVWHYDRLPDVGENLDLEFVDPPNTGEYRLRLTPEKREQIFTLWPCGKTINETFP